MPHLKAAFDLIDGMTSTIKEMYRPKSLLYVGWRHDCHPWWYKKFCPELGIEKIGILEIHPPNKQDADAKAWEGIFGVETKVMLGDVLEFEKHISVGEYDVIFWDHGPEHVTLEQLRDVTPRLTLSSKLLVYACPWGKWVQGPEGGNIHEEHKSYIEPEDLADLKMTVSCVGSSGQNPGLEGELIALR